MFARLDVAETLGIWRHATGEVVGIQVVSDGLLALDVQFDGHELLRGYVSALFRRVAD